MYVSLFMFLAILTYSHAWTCVTLWDIADVLYTGNYEIADLGINGMLIHKSSPIDKDEEKSILDCILKLGGTVKVNKNTMLLSIPLDHLLCNKNTMSTYCKHMVKFLT